MSLAAPVTFSVVAGLLPPGLTLDASGFLSGIPNTPGSYDFTIRATGSDANFTQRSYTMAAGEITPDVLSDATVGDPYAEALTANGFTSPEFSIVGGSLPSGLSLSPFSGVISGTPDTAELASFTVSVTDGVLTCDKDYSIEVVGDFWSDLIWVQSDGLLLATLDGGSFSGSPTGSECGVNPVFCRGEKTYTGPALNCNINGFTNYPSLFEVRIFWDWGGGGQTEIFLGTNFNGDAPFTIPVSVGEIIMVQFVACLPTLADPSGTSGGTLSVLP